MFYLSAFQGVSELIYNYYTLGQELVLSEMGMTFECNIGLPCLYPASPGTTLSRTRERFRTASRDFLKPFNNIHHKM